MRKVGDRDLGVSLGFSPFPPPPPRASLLKWTGRARDCQALHMIPSSEREEEVFPSPTLSSPCEVKVPRGSDCEGREKAIMDIGAQDLDDDPEHRGGKGVEGKSRFLVLWMDYGRYAPLTPMGSAKTVHFSFKEKREKDEKDWHGKLEAVPSSPFFRMTRSCINDGKAVCVSYPPHTSGKETLWFLLNS